MNNTKLFEAIQSSDKQTASCAAFSLKTHEHGEVQAAVLKTELDAPGIETASADDAEIFDKELEDLPSPTKEEFKALVDAFFARLEKLE